LWRYWRESGRTRLAQAAADMLPLIERCVDEHDALVRQAGLQALVASTGLIDLYRDPAAYATARNEARALQHYGLSYDTLDAAQLHELEPGLASGVAGGILWKDPWAVRDPAGLVKGYAQLFMQRGGQFVQAGIESLAQHNPGWALTLDNGQTLCAQRAVVALGPDAPSVLEPLGYRFPLIHKRGYHLHFRPLPSSPPLRHPICDSQAGYVLAPMRQGIRLATGVELARTNSPPTPVQVERARVIAQRVYPLGEPVETQPWMGRRPCLPDMRPIIGPAPRHEGLWLNFGHAHHGLTLGPVTGRLLAELMTRARPVVDPAPYAATRFPGN
jgi:D-amino-acid dehydrogenase